MSIEPMRVNDRIPKGARWVEAYLTSDEVIVMQGVQDLPADHDCDAMGCGSLEHVIERAPINSYAVIAELSNQIAALKKELAEAKDSFRAAVGIGDALATNLINARNNASDAYDRLARVRKLLEDGMGGTDAR